MVFNDACRGRAAADNKRWAPRQQPVNILKRFDTYEHKQCAVCKLSSAGAMEGNNSRALVAAACVLARLVSHPTGSLESRLSGAPSTRATNGGSLTYQVEPQRPPGRPSGGRTGSAGQSWSCAISLRSAGRATPDRQLGGLLVAGSPRGVGSGLCRSQGLANRRGEPELYKAAGGELLTWACLQLTWAIWVRTGCALLI
jgi:hypothetical protein